MKFVILAALIALAAADSAYERPAYEQPAYERPATYDRPAYDRPAYKPQSYEPAYKPAYEPAYKPAYEPAYKPAYEPAYKPSYEPTYAPRPHQFAWDVKDDYSYVNMGQNENSDGKAVTGSYHVTLPDGRTQTVHYKADSYGYTADVKTPEGGYAKSYDRPSYSAPSYERPSYSAPSYPTRDY